MLWAEGEVRVESRVFPSSATVGDEIFYYLRVTHPEGVSAAIPDPLPVEPLEIKKSEAMPQSRTGAGLVETFKYTLTAFELGEWPLPPVPVGISDASGVKQTFFSPPQTVRIVPSAKHPEKDELRAIKGPVSFGTREMRELLLAFLAVSQVLLVTRSARQRQFLGNCLVNSVTSRPPVLSRSQPVLTFWCHRFLACSRV
jgi:hypothetical protein